MAIVLVIITASTTANEGNPFEAIWNAINNQQQQITDLQKQVSDLQNRLDQIEEGLVVYYNFNEGKGTVVKDNTGRNIGTIYGATWVDGKFGKALSFDGVDDKINIPSSVLNGLNDVTSEFWVKTTDNHGYIISGARSDSINNEYLT